MGMGILYIIVYLKVNNKSTQKYTKQIMKVYKSVLNLSEQIIYLVCIPLYLKVDTLKFRIDT